MMRSILKAGAWVFRPQHKLIFSAPLDDIRDVQPRIPVEFRFATERDLLLLDAKEYGYSEEARHFGLERMRAGDRLVLAIHQGKVVYFGWLMFGQMDLAMRDYYFVPGRSIYAYKLFTHADYRGKQICPAFYSFLKRHYSPLGQERVLCWVASDNEASIKTHRSAGLLQTGAYWDVRILGRKKFLLNDAMVNLGIRPLVLEPRLARAAKESA